MKILLIITSLIFVSCGSGSSLQDEEQFKKNATFGGQVSFVLNKLFIGSAHAQMPRAQAAPQNPGGGGRATDIVSLFTAQALKHGQFEAYTETTLSALYDRYMARFNAIETELEGVNDPFYYDISRVKNKRDLAVQNGFIVIIGFNSSRAIESFHIVPLTQDRKFYVTDLKKEHVDFYLTASAFNDEDGLQVRDAFISYNPQSKSEAQVNPAATAATALSRPKLADSAHDITVVSREVEEVIASNLRQDLSQKAQEVIAYVETNGSAIQGINSVQRSTLKFVILSKLNSDNSIRNLVEDSHDYAGNLNSIESLLTDELLQYIPSFSVNANLGGGR